MILFKRLLSYMPVAAVVLTSTATAHRDGGYWSDYAAATTDLVFSDWMKLLDDNKKLTEISLITTHDALATCDTGSWCDTADVAVRASMVALVGVGVSILPVAVNFGPLAVFVALVAGPEILRDLTRCQTMT